jgi:tetratricopeptide (TPR) repeat protein
VDRIEQINQLLKEAPDDEFLLHAMALEYIKIGEDSKARVLFERILMNNPSYVGSYYHLGKLLERAGETDEAIKVYESGMVYAKKVGDQKAYGELRGAYEELTM